MRRTRESFEALLATERAFDVLQEAERSERGYALTENPVFLEPYETAVARGATLFDDVRARIGDNDYAQTQRLGVLRRLTKLKFEDMAGSVALDARRADQRGADAGRFRLRPAFDGGNPCRYR